MQSQDISVGGGCFIASYITSDNLVGARANAND